MKTHTGMISNYLVGDKIYSSNLGGDFYGGHTTMSIHSLNEKVEGNNLVFDAMLKQLVHFKQELVNGEMVTVHIEWDITDDYREYIACRALRVDVTENKE